mmetsp:Transcript_16755/g.27502  ORF Transcript_16755/g.27502 Transcript_16755/m.27502 type:complete len:130 (+) Transcript_16755:3-392(+)
MIQLSTRSANSMNVRRLELEWIFFDFTIAFEKSVSLSDKLCKNLVLKALQAAYGYVGAGIPLDLIRWNSEECRGILRMHNSDAVVVRSALELLGEYDERRCKITVLNSSHSLLSLAGNSRLYFQDIASQ